MRIFIVVLVLLCLVACGKSAAPLPYDTAQSCLKCHVRNHSEVWQTCYQCHKGCEKK